MSGLAGRRRAAVVDGSNIAHEEANGDGTPKVANIVRVCEELERLGYEPIVIVDAALHHRVDDPERLERLIDEGVVRQAPAGTDADFFVLETAEDRDAIVVSNDMFREWRDRYGWIDERRIPLMIVDGDVHVYEPDLPAAADG